MDFAIRHLISKDMYFLISQRFIKPSLRLYGVRCSILLYININLSIFGTLPIPVCLHPQNHPVFPLLYGAELNWFQCLWNIVLERVECIITVLPQVLLDCALKELNKVEFTVKLGQEDAQMPSCFNDFLNTGFLLICHACCLLLGSFRLSTCVLGSRTYHWGAEIGPICDNTTFKKNVNLNLISLLWLCCTATIHFWWWLMEWHHRVNHILSLLDSGKDGYAAAISASGLVRWPAFLAFPE